MRRFKTRDDNSSEIKIPGQESGEERRRGCLFCFRKPCIPHRNCQGFQEQGQSQGSQRQNQGDQTQKLSANENQGSQTSNQGGQYQIQGGETQGNQSQGRQEQTMSGHGGQTQGDQTLISEPVINTPIDIGGINLNLSVFCPEPVWYRCGPDKPHIAGCCFEQCEKPVISLLTLLYNFSSAITENGDKLINFYYSGARPELSAGTLTETDGCIFTFTPGSGADITVVNGAFEAVLINDTGSAPNLFSLLLNYINSLPGEDKSDDEAGAERFLYGGCFKRIAQKLAVFLQERTLLQISSDGGFFEGYILKINCGIIYMTDSLTSPSQIYAVPLCKIKSWQPAELPV